ncbi:hypothetical protein [Shewanella sp. GXUN23E]|uniref:hypothetical protein n=1 Tax=Shewanella sp. GXUN23E TaxID=3422498 RepID=UPI003D7E5F4E
MSNLFSGFSRGTGFTVAAIGLVGTVVGLAYTAFGMGEKHQMELMTPKLEEIAEYKGLVAELKAENSRLQTQNDTLNSSLDSIVTENRLVKQLLEAEKETVLKLAKENESRVAREKLNKSFAELKSQEYAGVAISVKDCLRNGSRLDCNVVFRAVEGDTSVTIRPTSAVYDDLGNAGTVISYIASNGTSVSADGYCSREFQLIDGVNTPFRLSFASPSNAVTGVSAIKMAFGSGCMSAKKILTFKEIPLVL